MATKDDDLDDFFDTPRIKSKNKSTEISKDNSATCYDVAVREPVGKPPAHPSSRPGSAVSRKTSTGRTSPVTKEDDFSATDELPAPRRTIQATIPNVAREADEEGNYSDDSFVSEDEGSSANEESGRRSPSPRSSYSVRQPEIKLSESEEKCSTEVNSDCHRVQPKGCDNDYSDESGSELSLSDDDSEVTDVSPLNTPHAGNMLTKSHSGPRGKSVCSNYAQNDADGLLHGDSDEIDLTKLLRNVLHMEKEEYSGSQHRPVHSQMPARRCKRNYTFTDEQMRNIDKENYRLMTRILAQSNKTKKPKTKPKLSSTIAVRPNRPSSAAINRKKQQEKIDAENEKLYRRLQQTRPTKDLRRDLLVAGQTSVGGFTSSMRPLSAGRGRGYNTSSVGPSAASGVRARPTSAYTYSRRYPQPSRPATAFPSCPDDDDVLTWSPNDFS